MLKKLMITTMIAGLTTTTMAQGWGRQQAGGPDVGAPS